MLPKIALRTTGGQLSEAARQVTEQITWENLEPIERAQLRATRPDLCPKEGEKE